MTKRITAFLLAIILTLSLMTTVFAEADKSLGPFGNGNNTNYCLPFNIYYSDGSNVKSQFIYWDNMSTAVDQSITSLTFYANSNSNTGNAKWTITLTEVDESFDFGSFETKYIDDSAGTVVWDNKPLPAISGKKLTIPCDTPHLYGGGYLVVTVTVTQAATSGTSMVSFYGKTYGGYTGRYTYYYSKSYKADEGTLFLPKMSFTYKHIHGKWAYTANQSTVTATCGQKGCSKTPASASLTLSATGKTYDGTAVVPAFTSTTAWENLELTVPTIGLSYSTTEAGSYAVATEAINAGYYKASFSVGTGSDLKTVTVPFAITPKALDNSAIATISDMTYTGEALKPEITVSDGAKELASSTDYDVTYASNTNVGTAKVTATMKGNYSGTPERTFQILPASEGISVSTPSDMCYDGFPKTPEVTVSFNGKTLASGTDYDIAYASNTDVGMATVTVTMKGNFAGTFVRQFRIGRITDGITVSTPSDVTYNGQKQTPNVTVSYKGKTLSTATDYDIVYASNTDAGTATVTVTMKGAYEGTFVKNFTIKKADYDMSGIKFASATDVYDGKEHRPSIKGHLPKGADNIRVSVSYSEGKTNVGEKEVTATFSTDSKNYNTPEPMVATQTVTPAGITWVFVRQSGKLTYTGRAQTARVQTFCHTVNHQKATFTYATAPDGVYSTTVPAFTAVGTHTVYYKVTAPNHSDRTGTFQIQIKNRSTSGSTGNVSSAKTGDCGIALYAGLAISATMGSGLVIGKRRKF